MSNSEIKYNFWKLDIVCKNVDKKIEISSDILRQKSFNVPSTPPYSNYKTKLLLEKILKLTVY